MFDHLIEPLNSHQMILSESKDTDLYTATQAI